MTETKTSENAFVSIKPALHQAIAVMEHLNGGNKYHGPSFRKSDPWPQDDDEQVSEEVAQLEYSPDKTALLDQSLMIWDLAIRRKMPLVWFVRRHRPVAVLVSVLCDQAEIPAGRLLNGEINDQDFENLRRVVVVFSNSPLWFHDARRPDSFRKGLESLHASAITYAVCDWVLEGEELASANHLACESAFSFLYPKGRI